MPRVIKNFKVELNSADNLRDLVQNVIDLADTQINQAQNEIEKLKKSTDLTQEVMDGKSKHGISIKIILNRRKKK